MLANIAKLSLALILPIVATMPKCPDIIYEQFPDPQGYSGGSIFDGAGGVGTGTTTGSGTGTGTGTGTLSIDCGDGGVPAIIKYYLINKMGLTENAAAGIMGNIKQESEYNSYIVNPHTILKEGQKIYENGKNLIGGQAFGLLQWKPDDRVSKLQEYADKKGKSVTDPIIQLEYMEQEMTGTLKDLEYLKVTKEELNAATLEGATEIFLKKFEQPGNYDEEMKIRLPYAEEALGISIASCKATEESSPFTEATITTGGVPATIPSLSSFAVQFGNGTSWRGSSCGSGSGSSIEASGCSLVAVANAMKFLGKKPDNPTDIAHEITQGTPLVCGADQTGWDGSNMSVDVILRHYNLTQTDLWTSESLSSSEKLQKIRQALSNGGPVIMHGARPSSISCDSEDNRTNGNCVFSKGGHFVLAVGVSGDNKIYIANPANNSGAYIPFPYEGALRYCDHAAMIK